MPFTPTHLLAAVPMSRCWPGTPPIAALAIGTVTPDWPLFVPWGPDYATTHSLLGTLTHALPLLGLYFWFCYRRAPIVALDTPLLGPRLRVCLLVALFLLAGLAAITAATQAAPGLSAWSSLRLAVYAGIISGVRMFVFGALCYCLCFQLWYQLRLWRSDPG